MPLVVTLVHGTWAQDARWTQEGSALRNRLTDAFGADTAFRVFPWSGGNSFRARSTAAAELRSFLRRGLTEAAGAEHVVVAHSHGGNVALEALRGFDGSAQIAAVVCLATPFIVTRPRKFGDRTDLVVSFAKLIASLSVGFGAGITIDSVFHPFGYWVPFMLFVAALAGVGTWWALTRSGTAWRRRAEAWASEVGVTAPKPPTKLFVVRAAADEAAEGLAALHFPLVLVLRGWKGMAALVVLPLTLAAIVDEWARHRVFRRIITGAALWSAVAAWTRYEYPHAPADRVAWLLGYLAFVMLYSAFFSTEVGLLNLVGFLTAPVFVLLGVVFVAVLIVLSLASVPFNTSLRDLIPFLRVAIWLGPIDISAEPAPPGGTGAIHQLSNDAQTGLQHSTPYDDPEALGWMVDSIQRMRQDEVT